jgi:hypothetical protein
MKAALATVIAFSIFQLRAETASPSATLTGIVNLPGVKIALLEVQSAQRKIELVLGEGQRDEPVEVTEIRPDEGRVNVRIKGEPVWLNLGIATNSPSENASIVLTNASLGHVLFLYSRCTGCSLLQHPLLSRDTRFNLISDAPTLQETRHAIEAAFGEKHIATIPDGERFIIVAPNSEIVRIKPNAPKTHRSATGENTSADQMIPLGMLDLRRADDYQAAALYADLIGGKKLDLSQRITWTGPPAIYITAVTPLSKEEAIYALKTLLSWRNINIVPAAEGFVKAVRANDNRAGE